MPRRTTAAGIDVLIGGQTAIFDDFPSELGVVVLVSFLLLMAVFRSVVVPVIASVMNLLATGASFGVVIAVFQWGWLGACSASARPGRSRRSCR